MRVRSAWCLVVSVCVVVFPLSASAKATLLEPGALDWTGEAGDEAPPAVQLADYHGAAPVTPAPVPRPYVPAPVRHSGSGSLLLLGLGLTAGGLVLGGAGFAVLYVCRAGTACHNDTTTVIGWVLAAPGIIPLTVGLIMIWLSTGSSARVMAPARTPSRQWAFGFAPLAGGGGLVSAATQF
ncbi:MAG: hypothetical protein U0228_26545 [Myxococcaceae bacterium]